MLRIADAFNSGDHLSRSSSVLAEIATITLAFKHHALRAESFSQTTNKVFVETECFSLKMSFNQRQVQAIKHVLP